MATCVANVSKRHNLLPQGLHNSRFYSRLFLVPEPGNKWRPVIDLRVLDKCLLVPNFKIGDSSDIRKLGHKRRMASFDRPERCILSRAHTPRFSTLAMFPCRQANASVQSTAIAVGDCTTIVHADCKRGSFFSLTEFEFTNTWTTGC